MPLALTALISGVIVILDQISKRFLKDANSVLIPGLLRLTGARNTGAAFSLFSDSVWILPLVTALLTLAVLAYIIKVRPKGLMGAALAMILGGAAGNLADRLSLGYVIDFIQLDFIRFPIFNLADIAVVSGCLCAALAIMLTKEEPHA